MLTAHRLPLSLLATPVVVGAMSVAVPALAGTGGGGPTAHLARTSATHCVTVRSHGRRILQCVARGARGPRGFPGPAGPRGFNGAKGATGTRGRTGAKGTTGATGATGAPGPQGPTGVGGRAWAVVNPAPLGLVAAQSSGFQSVRSPAQGIYCLTPSAGINPGAEPASVTGETSYSGGGVVPIATLNAQRNGCNQSEFEVITYNAAALSSGPVGGVAFTIIAP
jgi:Collagen triple helix repeat (20 copies)